MSQVKSTYERKKNDFYPTPSWVTHALLPHLPRETIKTIWEPACGDGAMVRAIEEIWPETEVWGTDIDPLNEKFGTTDFLSTPHNFSTNIYVDMVDAIITNPPYDKAHDFIERALALCPEAFVCMLLRVDYDSAKTRRRLFADCASWRKKVVLTKRIKWFDGPASPSEKHAWYIWGRRHENCGLLPTIAYAGG